MENSVIDETICFVEDSPQSPQFKTKNVHFAGLSDSVELMKRANEPQYQEIRREAELIKKQRECADSSVNLEPADIQNWSICTNDLSDDDEVATMERNINN